MKVALLTCGVFPSTEEMRKKMWIFLRSVEKFGAGSDLHVYGVGRIFPGYRAMKLDWQLEYLKKIASEYTHVCYTDGWDAFMTDHWASIVLKYLKMEAPTILVSAFTQLANESLEAEHYPGCFDHTITYRYPNVGGYFADIAAIIEAFERMVKLPRQTGDDCFNWYDGWKEGWFRPTLDSKCQIFQVSTDACDVQHERLHNFATGSFPGFLHISGGYTDQQTGKDDRLIPWARRLGVIE